MQTWNVVYIKRVESKCACAVSVIGKLAKLVHHNLTCFLMSLAVLRGPLAFYPQRLICSGVYIKTQLFYTLHQCLPKSHGHNMVSIEQDCFNSLSPWTIFINSQKTQQRLTLFSAAIAEYLRLSVCQGLLGHGSLQAGRAESLVRPHALHVVRASDWVPIW